MHLFPILVTAALAASPNVILISVDTLRADHLGFYGYEHNTSPNLDALADHSLVFDNMICEIPLTSPSFCSMMSSQYPRALGTTRNGLPLPEDTPTVSKLFQAAGYETFCVQSNWTLRSKLSNLDRGFDVYDDDFHERRWGVIKSERSAQEVTRIALAMLEGRDESKPLFAWIHYSDPHAPYKRHRKFEVSEIPSKRRDEATRIRGKYDSEIAFTDHQIGRLLEAIPRENTYIVFLADHGESLWEHDYLGHGRRIYQTCLHVPLMIHGASVQRGRTDVPARGIDVAPTLLALAGLAPASSMLGLDLLNSPPPRDRVRVVETYGGAVPRLPGARALMAGRGPQRQSVLLENWKLILNGDQTELFDLGADPAELVDLSGENPERVSRLAEEIRRWDAAVARAAGEEAVLTEDDEEALESLGYIE